MSNLEIGLLCFAVIENVITWFVYRKMKATIKAYREAQSKYEDELNSFAIMRNVY